MSDVPILAKTEMQLCGWSVTHNNGVRVTFWLPDKSALEPFESLTERKGKTAGQRVMGVFVLIGDDEQPADPEPDKPKGGPLARLAGMWCAEDAFRCWLWDTFPKYQEGNAEDVDWAAASVRDICQVLSRAQLDQDPRARALFDELIRRPYAEYRAQHAPQQELEP